MNHRPQISHSSASVPLKVLNLTSSPHVLGGVETLLLNAVGKYDARRFDVAFCNLFSGADEVGGNAESALYNELRARKVKYFHVPGNGWRDMPALVNKLARLLRRERFDILHSHMLHATLIGHLAARVAGVRVRIASRQYTGEVFYNKGGWVRRLDSYMMKTATHIVACSGSVRDTLLREEKIAREKITVVYNSIDLRAIDEAKPSSPAPWDASWNDCLMLGSVGNLHPRKGHADLLRALPQVLEVEPRARLVILGEGVERANLEALARELGIADRVLLAGFRDDTLALIHKFNLYVHPSLHEPFGIAIAEAMAARKAVVCAATGGIPEVVGEDGAAGVLVSPGNPAELADAIIRLLGDPEAMRRMGEHGRRRAAENFSVEVTVENYQELYARLTSGKI